MQQAVAHAPPAPRSWLDRLWSSIADRGRPYAAMPNEAAPGLQRAEQLAKSLLSSRGEASGAALARELHTVLLKLGGDDRLSFLRYLVTEFLPDPVALRQAAEAYLTQPDDPQTVGLLAEAAEPPRQELLRRMNMAPGGTAALVELRKELLGLLRDHPELKQLDSDLRHLLVSWFNRGFLELRRIDWQTPAAVLEKLIKYEAVHEIDGWNDLRRRLAPDRRCFGFFHPALPSEPLIFVEVALHDGLATAVQPLLAPESELTPAHENQADTAIFYSISNCQAGLRGVSFGNFLIKQVVEELKAELPRLTRFATLSPVPGFRRWFDARLQKDASARDLLRPGERILLLRAAGMAEDSQDDAVAFQTLLQTEGWWETPALNEALRQPLLRACASFLTQQSGGSPADPVARFHLGNGAGLEQVNWLGNVSPRGMAESLGIMVNYLYDLRTIEANHEAFMRGSIVRSARVDGLLASGQAAGTKAGRSAVR